MAVAAGAMKTLAFSTGDCLPSAVARKRNESLPLKPAFGV